ncbi:unnamed protein product [Larinioides sclopetarius]|uniref:Uncharacterized protein n=1 Tax=Larinioides sclopetarius TaxID=280406 RepID=A0AAV1ZVR3_9ARAC
MMICFIVVLGKLFSHIQDGADVVANVFLFLNLGDHNGLSQERIFRTSPDTCSFLRVIYFHLTKKMYKEIFMILLFVTIVYSQSACSPGICDRIRCKPAECGPGEKLYKNGGICHCCDICLLFIP